MQHFIKILLSLYLVLQKRSPDVVSGLLNLFNDHMLFVVIVVQQSRLDYLRKHFLLVMGGSIAI